MDKRKKYFCVVAMVLILLSGYGKISDSAFRMRVTRMIAGEGCSGWWRRSTDKK